MRFMRARSSCCARGYFSMQLRSAGSVVQAQAPSALAVCQASSAALLLLQSRLWVVAA